LLILSICIVCPLIETLDYWDHTLQTGNDTEYAFLILGLCAGASYAVARAALRIIASLSSQGAGILAEGLPVITFAAAYSLFIVASLSASPPLTALRI
jgi:hypothetical protein